MGERARKRKEWIIPEDYDPLGTCPTEKRARYANLAAKARAGSLPAIFRLKCLECVCWFPGEVKRCDIKGCALWARIARREA